MTKQAIEPSLRERMSVAKEEISGRSGADSDAVRRGRGRLIEKGRPVSG
jgi:hypothetical protein